MSGRYRLSVRQSFGAAHFLRCYQGKCESLHGHNFRVTLVVSGTELLPDVEFLVDFGDLKTILREVLAPLDHACLNEVPPFDRLNPSSENLARHIFHEVKARLPQGVAVDEVRVAETEMQEAAYSEPAAMNARG